MTRLSAWFGVAIVVIAASLVGLHAQPTFKASTIDGQATIADGLASVSFKIAFTNEGPSQMTHVVVVFADNTEVTIGDVAGEATVTTETQNRTVDVSGFASGTVVMDVTLKYSVDGENFETPWILSVLAQ